MRLRQLLSIAAVAMLAASCREMPLRLDSRRIVASVDGVTLHLAEVSRAMPDGVASCDSLDFATQYVERWIMQQVKIREAERIFSSSVSEVEELVAEYRNSLLTRKLDQYYINNSRQEPFSDSDIKLYYHRNMNNFRLDNTIVKGMIVILPKSYDGVNNIKMLVGGDENDHLNLLSICERIEGAVVKEYHQWMDYDNFIALLPLSRDAAANRQYLRRSGAQSLADEEFNYLFRVDAFRSAGYVAPIDVAEPQIRKILSVQHQQQILDEQVSRLYREAERTDRVKRY